MLAPLLPHVMSQLVVVNLMPQVLVLKLSVYDQRPSYFSDSLSSSFWDFFLIDTCSAIIRLVVLHRYITWLCSIDQHLIEHYLVAIPMPCLNIRYVPIASIKNKIKVYGIDCLNIYYYDDKARTYVYQKAPYLHIYP